LKERDEHYHAVHHRHALINPNLDNLVSCPCASFGCEVRAPLWEIADHLQKRCAFNVIKCNCSLHVSPYIELCHADTMRANYDSHISQEHEQGENAGIIVRTIPCPLSWLGCEETMRLDSIAAHFQSNCKFYDIDCKIFKFGFDKDGCTKSDTLNISEWKEHVCECHSEQNRIQELWRTDFVDMEIICPICKMKIKRKSYVSHVKKCEEYKMICHWCHDDIAMEDFSLHCQSAVAEKTKIMIFN